MHISPRGTAHQDGLPGLLRVWNEPTHLTPPRSNKLFIPNTAAELAEHYDLTISQPSADLGTFARFNQWLAEACQTMGMSAALIHDGVVHEVIHRLDDERLTIGY